jgi:triosephosphate isomerase
LIKTLIAANWKMNTNFDEAKQLINGLLSSTNLEAQVETLVCPPFVYLQTISNMLEDKPIKLGAQNMYFEEKGAYTGEISPSMVAEFCDYVIIGHSERRQLFGDTNAIVNRKLISAISYDLTPILCVGENLLDRENGDAENVVGQQLEESLDGIAQTANLIVAYEPVWAIGTGMAATSDLAEDIMKFIRLKLASIYDDLFANNLTLLYGGSVTSDNVKDYLGQIDINGALVGGASLDAQKFKDIIDKAGEID